MNQISLDNREKILALQREIAKLPQYEFPTSHLFADGMYTRVVACPQGSVLVGKIHKKEHIFIVASGKIRISEGAESFELTAPYAVVSKPGTKRAGYALEDCVCMTVHRSDKTDLDELEEELIEKEDGALLDSSNHIKVLT